MLLLALLGCSCVPELPTPSADPEEPPPMDSATSAEAPPCDIPEEEPNDAVPNAYTLGLEACGVFDPPAEVDAWSFELTEDGWLDVAVNAQLIGSTADVRLLLDGPDGAALQRDDDPGTTDPRLVFPAAAGVWTARLVDEKLGGGERYDWILFADVGKEPVDWTSDEVEPNDLPVIAMPLGADNPVFGWIDAFDADWYRAVVPGLPGDPVQVTVRVAAYAFGSPANTALTILDEDLDEVVVATHGLSAVDHDPIAVAVVAGGDTIYVSVVEEATQGGPNYWYVLTLEAP